MSGPKLIALAAGGTGGHLFPAEALARELMTRGYRVAVITDRRGQAFGEKLGVELHCIRAGRLEPGITGKIVAVAEMALGTLGAQRLLKRLAPACVAGFGGYPSVPTMIAASRLKLPTLIHEQNALLGRANRLLAPRVAKIATSFAETQGIAAKDRAKVALTGNPVRPAIAMMRGVGYPTVANDEPFKLLVFGGSQGARILSHVVPRALALLEPPLRKRLEVTQQARPEDLEATRQAYLDDRIAAELASFFDDVPARMASAHLVISRAGASSVAELSVIGRPAILVPFAAAAEDHQTLNARSFVGSGAAWVMSEKEFTPEALASRLTALMGDATRLSRAAAIAATLGRPQAARDLAALVDQLAGGANGNGNHAPAERRAA
jgi:UDP-N-acetylglucosamine--N-acetylmuramyl-(pentapeptide) pyrophosphoryl-undecaprenol N-acetylglucosamine transferase